MQEFYGTLKLEETGLFNCNGGQSTVFNRLKNNNIITLQELFEKTNLQYGSPKMGNNRYIYDEIDGIIRLLKYKYLGEYPEGLKDLLNFRIKTFYMPLTKRDYGNPGKVFRTIFERDEHNNLIYSYFDSFYKVLKSCGFDQVGAKALMDIAYYNNINDMTLGEFISNLNIDEVQKMFSRVPQEYLVFINVLDLIIGFYNNEKELDNSARKR